MKLCLLIAVLFIYFKSDAQFKSLNLEDSAAVSRFTATHSICDQIFAAEVYKMDIVKEKGNGALILQSISKLTGYKFFIPIASGGLILSDDSKSKTLQEQLNEAKTKANCGNIDKSN